MIAKVMIGQRWHHIYRYRTIYHSAIVEILAVTSSYTKGKVVQVIESTDNNDICRKLGSVYEYASAPYGDGENSWELLANQDAPKE